MKLTDSGGGNYEQPPIGTHVARCIKVIDLGTQRGEYQGKATIKRQQENIAEERRLFYVAATRAQETLVVTAVASSHEDGPQPSRFLAELAAGDREKGKALAERLAALGVDPQGHEDRPFEQADDEAHDTDNDQR